MKTLYEDEYNLLHKIQKNAKYENSIDERKLNSSFRPHDYSGATAYRTEAGSSLTPQLYLKSAFATNLGSPKHIEDEDYGFGRPK
jgi:hypothetical protein